jgi:hypothetical protein
MMNGNGITEPLPGLLDDPQFSISDLPALTDFHIAPLKDPAPLKHSNVPLPLEPVTANGISTSRSARAGQHNNERLPVKRTPQITPSDVLLAREAKKPHLAISELIEDVDAQPQHLPTYISLSVVEKSPIPTPSRIEAGPVLKKPRLDYEIDLGNHEFGRQLPRPAQKEVPASRPAPLLPAMVTGLHEPPPSAALLPSMDLDQRPSALRMGSSKINVKDILRDVSSKSPSPAPPPKPHPVPESVPPVPVFPPASMQKETPSPIETEFTEPPPKDSKARRARRKWTDTETQDLLAGVRKYGIGKWKQILDDAAYSFVERSSVDLKDRYRVCARDESLSMPSLITTVSTTGSAEQPRSPDSPSQLPTPQSNQTKQRRKRRAWTDVEDSALLAGVAKHGFQWTAIHDDPQLELGHRRATDLRDRIRNKYPDGYKHAESAPFRSELKRAEKQRAKDASSEWKRVDSGDSSFRRLVPLHGNEKPFEREPERPSVTLPSLTLDDDDLGWNTRLPPLLPWEDLG